MVGTEGGVRTVKGLQQSSLVRLPTARAMSLDVLLIDKGALVCMDEQQACGLELAY